jgi:hypothetical protein
VKECANELAGVRTTPKTYPTLNTFILIHLRRHSMQKVCVKLAKIESLSLAAKPLCHLLREIIIGRSNPMDRAIRSDEQRQLYYLRYFLHNRCGFNLPFRRLSRNGLS